jgi:hypothetical protein
MDDHKFSYITKLKKKTTMRSQTLWTHFIGAPKVCMRSAKMCSGTTRHLLHQAKKGSEGKERSHAAVLLHN